jgi:(aminoalkyl)phosphonate N-acetyltransferase
MITVRRANEWDADRVRSLIEKLEAPQVFSAEQFRQVYCANLADPNIIYLVVEIDGVVAAFSSLRFSIPLRFCRPAAEIGELVVDERERGKSVGAQLVNAMMLLARDRGCCCLEVVSHRLSKRAHHFFAKHGFILSHYKLTMDIDFKAC